VRRNHPHLDGPAPVAVGTEVEKFDVGLGAASGNACDSDRTSTEEARNPACKPLDNPSRELHQNAHV